MKHYFASIMSIGQNKLASYANMSIGRIVNAKISFVRRISTQIAGCRNPPIWQISSLGEGDKDTQKD